MGSTSNLEGRLVSGHRAVVAALWALACALLTTGGSATAFGQVESAVETFDAAWEIIAETHFDPEFGGLDWNGVRDELRPRAEAAESTAELRVVINEMLSRLELSHFALWPQEALGGFEPREGDGAGIETGGGPARPGFETTMVDDAFVVSHVEADGPAANAGVQTGWIVQRVDDVEVAEHLALMREYVDAFEAGLEARRIMARLLSGTPRSEVEIEFLDGDDAEQLVTLERRRPDGDLSRFGNMPPLLATLESRILEPDVDLEIGVINFSIWLPVLAREFDIAVDQMRQADGIVLDLRGNPGGLGGMVMGIGGHFVAESRSLGTMHLRDSDLQFMTNPRRVDRSGEPVEPFAGPLAILIDNTSASTSEVFTGGLQAIGRARVFGQRSMGAVLPSLMDRLPNGDVLQHAIADFVVTANGGRLEGRGVRPDEEVEVTRADLLAGRDPTLEAALEWIAGRR